MSGIVSPGGAGLQAAQELLKQAEGQSKSPTKTPGKTFDSVLNKPEQVDQAHAAKQAQTVNETQKVHQNNPLHGAKPSDPVSSPLKTALNSLMNSSHSMDKIMQTAMSGKNFSQGELIGLQAATYKTTSEIEAVTKLAETASGAVKSTLQTQV